MARRVPRARADGDRHAAPARTVRGRTGRRPITVAATSGVAPQLAGLVSGVLNTTRQLSGAVGLAVLTTVTASAADRAGNDRPAALAHGNAVAFAVSAAAAFLASVCAWTLLRRPRRAEADAGPTPPQHPGPPRPPAARTTGPGERPPPRTP